MQDAAEKRTVMGWTLTDGTYRTSQVNPKKKIKIKMKPSTPMIALLLTKNF